MNVARWMPPMCRRCATTAGATSTSSRSWPMWRSTCSPTTWPWRSRCRWISPASSCVPHAEQRSGACLAYGPDCALPPGAACAVPVPCAGGRAVGPALPRAGLHVCAFCTRDLPQSRLSGRRACRTMAVPLPPYPKEATAMAPTGPGGLDASPRGDPAGFVQLQDDKTLLLPERRGNNRADSLRNIVADPRVALLFLIPGVGETLRVNGHARISVAPDLMERFAVNGQPPKCVIVVDVQAVYFQCARAIQRSRLCSAVPPA